MTPDDIVFSVAVVVLVICILFLSVSGLVLLPTWLREGFHAWKTRPIQQTDLERKRAAWRELDK